MFNRWTSTNRDKSSPYWNLVNKNGHQVFLLMCPTNIPISLAFHSWIVCNNKGEITRWEGLSRQYANQDSGYIFKNAFPTFSGTGIFPGNFKHCWRAKLIGLYEGEFAKDYVHFIMDSINMYPNKNYSKLGTNSNTYTQWVLDKCPKINVKLPWNCIGKNVKY